MDKEQKTIYNIKDVEKYKDQLKKIRIWVCNTSCGKSYLCKVDDRFVDLDKHRSDLMFQGVQDFDEQSLVVMEKYLAMGKIILNASHRHFLNYLDTNNIPFVYMYPKKGLQAEYIERMRNRGSSEEFIQKYGTKMDDHYDHRHEDKRGTFKIEMNSGEFVSDYLWKVFGKK